MRGMRTAKFMPGIKHGQRFFEGSWLPQIRNGYSRAIPIRCLRAFVEKAVKSCDRARSYFGACPDLFAWFAPDIRRMWAVRTAAYEFEWWRYDTLEYWGNLPARTMGVARTARNRYLYYLSQARYHGNCGVLKDGGLSLYSWLYRLKCGLYQNSKPVEYGLVATGLKKRLYILQWLILSLLPLGFNDLNPLFSLFLLFKSQTQDFSEYSHLS